MAEHAEPEETAEATGSVHIPDPEASGPGPSDHRVILPLWLLVFSSSSQTMIIAPILPQIGSRLAVPEAILGTLVSAYAFMVGVCALVAGPISDRVGRRRILVLGSGTMTLALTFHLLVTGYWSFLAVRVFAGTAGGILSGAAVAYVGDFFPYEKRGWATGWVMSGSAFGQILGIPVGVVLAGALGFKAPFLAFALTMTLTSVLLWVWVPTVPMACPPFRRISVVGVTVTEGRRLSVPGAVRDYRAMLGQREVFSAATAFFLISAGVSLFMVYFPTWLEGRFGATPEDIGVLFLIGGIGNVISGPQAGRLSDRMGRKRILLASFLGLSLLIGATPWATRSLWVAYPLFFLAMMLIAMRTGAFGAMLTALVPAWRRGALMSLTVAMGQVGYSLGGAAAGPLYTRLGFAGDTLLGAAVALGAGLVIWFRLPEPHLPGK